MAKIVSAPAAASREISKADDSSLPKQRTSSGSGDGSREEKKMGVDQVRKAADHAQEVAWVFGRSLRFEVKEAAGLVQVSVLDAVSNKVVRKIPPDSIVHFVEHVREMLGALMDTEA
ncbi:MAG: flagellar protein FlaG [Synergistaceae bacterium]|nr:flagellar protein FlaG [Synergistaceae bacterium]